MKTQMIATILAITYAACTPKIQKLPPANTIIKAEKEIKEKPVESTSPSDPTNPAIPMGSINGKWQFFSASEKKFTSLPLPELNFDADQKKLWGTTGCNQLNAFFFTTNNQMAFSPIAITKKKCADANLEKYLSGFLKNVATYKVENNQLFLFLKQDKTKYVLFLKM